MHLQSLNARLAKALHLSSRQGALVTFVEPDSMAEHQGIQRGDLITGANGKPIASLYELVMFFNTKHLDRTIALQVWRDNKTHTVDIPLGPAD
jgi:S1-C subfamily serine protease